MNIFPIEPLRQAFLSLPEQQQQSGDTPIEMQYFYVPLSHAKALHPDSVLVEGIRGSGKSEWWLELLDENRRKLVAEFSPRAELINIQCSAGFGQIRSSHYPDKKMLGVLLKTIDAQTIWNTIVAWTILGTTKFSLSIDALLGERVNNYQTNFEILDNQLVNIDSE